MKKTRKAMAAIMLMTGVVFIAGCGKDPNSGSKVPEGALNGVFTVNDEGKQIYFSKGNLWCYNKVEEPYWKFAEHQWDCNTGDAVCYFCWGTSGYNHGAIQYAPDCAPSLNSDFYAYGDPKANLGDYTGKADWGYNAIVNGGNQEGLWRTPLLSEFFYLMRHRKTASDVRFVRAMVNDLDGYVFFPDDWDASKYTIINPNVAETYTIDNNISAADWTDILEPAGCVFFPAAGQLSLSSGTAVIVQEGREGAYWCSNIASNVYPCCLNILYHDLNLGTQVRDSRYCVRLVRDVQ